MNVKELNGIKIEIYDTPEELPIKRYQRFNKFLMKANEVGNDFSDYNARTLKAMEFLKKKMMDEAVVELDNRRQLVFNAFMEYSPSSFALAILVKSIDGEVFTDYSEEGLMKVLDRLDEIGFSENEKNKTIKQVKKK